MNYSTDKTPVLPMIGREFTNKNSEDIDKIKAAKPKRDQYTTDEEYNKAMAEHKARLDAAERIIKQYINLLLIEILFLVLVGLLDLLVIKMLFKIISISSIMVKI